MGIEQTGMGGNGKGLVVVIGVLLLLVVVYFGARGPSIDEPPRPWHSETSAPSGK